MPTDPRLRLLGDESVAHTSTLLHALDDVRIAIRTGPDMAGRYTIALAAFMGMTARLFGQVVLERPVSLADNWWGATDTDQLMTALDNVRPRPPEQPRRELVVTFGDRVPAGVIGIGGDDYTIRLGTKPQPFGQNASHALGVHGAVCIAVSQLLLIALESVGFSGVRVVESYVANLIDYNLTAAPEAPPNAGQHNLHLAVAGVGSVGSSSLALLATALGNQDTMGTPVPRGTLAKITTIDADTIDPTRNPFRYPALLGTETGSKAEYFADRLTKLGFEAQAAPGTVADWVRSQDQPGFDGLLLSSVDTLTGRLEVTDALARSTLSLGVSGLSLHAQREFFADGFACPFCDYVSAQPPMTQADVHAVTTGLPVPRVLSLMQEGARLTDSDVDQAIAAGKVPAHRRDALIGATINDLVRQAYAEGEVRSPSGDGVVAVAAPQVSWFAGVLAAAEIVKQVQGLPVVDRRVDVDLTGLPPGLVRRIAADRTGRCLCRSGTRIRWYRELYEKPPMASGAS
ncbi:hypothetical protein E143388_07411 [Rhodococcus opacus]|nr:hypothetical protein E143388_07411 [Rhodococcus opacus]